MVFWKENAEDGGYSYWGYLDNLVAMSGEYVDVRDYVNRVANIDDEQYFTFNSQKTEKNVLVEGDGSTVVNVYYTRNYYNITFKAKGKCTIPEGHIHTTECYDVICDMGHTHSAECNPKLECETEEHIAHDESCIICGLQAHIHGGEGCECNIHEHTHVKECWSGASANSTNPTGAPRDPEQGQIYYRSRRYYIYLFGKWYQYSTEAASSGDIEAADCGYNQEHTHKVDCDCNEVEHEHTASCVKDILHQHAEDCYTYSCNSDSHTHVDECYRLKCGITANHSHNSTCNNTNSTNTVKVVTRKYEQSIEDIWPITDDNGKTYDSGERWKPSNSSYYSQVLVCFARMLPENLTLTLDESSYTPYTMNYYLQVLPGESYTTTHNGKNYILSNTVKASYNYVTKAEDFFDIKGFDQSDSNPAFKNDQISISGNSRNVDFYYDRKTDNVLEFNNNGTVLNDKTVSGVMYGSSLEEYDFVPDYPDNLEPNAYTFAGWYTSPGCFDGTQVNWSTVKMTDEDMMFYAKWVPIMHTVKVYLDATLKEQIGETQVVDHKSFANAPRNEDVSNGLYIFQGWFYKDTQAGETVEKAFVFTGIPIIEDMVIYAKWSSHVSVDYKINYVLKNTGEPIADPTVGSAIAGHNKTFDAKAGDDLYPEYRQGYYPLASSHTVTMSADQNHEYTFEYVYVESMPYLVEYINASTGKKLKEDRKVYDNNYAVVTETFEKFPEMMPDAYQKRLVLSASGVDEDNDNILDNNRITFYYEPDKVHAYYRVTHYIRSLDSNTYREYLSEEAVGVIGQEYSVEALTLTGFNFNGALTKINGTEVPQSDSTVSSMLGSDGMHIELYYDRIEVDYAVRYLLYGTQKEISPTKNAKGFYGEQIIEYAKDLSDSGYKSTGAQYKTLNLSANAEHNIIEFLYQEDTASIKYELIGPDGCGYLSYTSENLNAVSGEARGSTPTVYKGFEFKGWFTDADCKNPVNPSFVAADNTLKPQKTGSAWHNTTYYAKYIALSTDLVITTRGAYDIDENQAFLFRVKGKEGTATAGIDIYVSVIGNGSTTIKDLPLGNYNVTELLSWSWRYSNDNAVRELELQYNNGSNTLIFEHHRKNELWLDGNTAKSSKF